MTKTEYFHATELYSALIEISRRSGEWKPRKSLSAITDALDRKALEGSIQSCARRMYKQNALDETLRYLEVTIPSEDVLKVILSTREEILEDLESLTERDLKRGLYEQD